MRDGEEGARDVGGTRTAADGAEFKVVHGNVFPPLDDALEDAHHGFDHFVALVALAALAGDGDKLRRRLPR